ncbi:MAG TPA: 2-oxo-4-hydroxy-4-carboxy-5-ureidoimidazoline decarboxylase [Mycobacterium sp.]|nr:2-oxo-4-hydroxy-4-carboxy-5-ureidoimidazoline decarboxylase [Mycobacterium sp.]
MLLHQGIGLDAFNRMAPHRALHALYECCGSVILAGDLASGRPYANREELFRRADALLFALSDDSVDNILQTYPHIGRRPGSSTRAEQCSVWDPRPEVMAELDAATQRYAERFKFSFMMFVGSTDAEGVLAAIADRLQHDTETERKVVCNELAKLNRTRLERMLGPADGFDNW